MQLKNMFYIKEVNWYEIISWAQLAYDKDKNEISGLATAVPDNTGKYFIGDIEILKQENSGGNTELEADAVTAYKVKYGMQYKNPDMKFVWWHSHHTMAAFWSGTDEKEINAWENESFSLALVVNLKEEYKFRVSVWKAGKLPIEQHYDTSLNIVRDAGINVTKGMFKQYKKLCSNKASNVINTYNNGYNIHNNVNQRYLWNNHQASQGVSYRDRQIHEKLVELIGDNIDEFMVEAISYTRFKEELKELQTQLKVQKVTDFTIKIPDGKKQDYVNLFEHILPNELIEYNDNTVKENYKEDVHNGWAY